MFNILDYIYFIYNVLNIAIFRYFCILNVLVNVCLQYILIVNNLQYILNIL